MPPHCDSLDGPVVSAARLALDAEDVDRVLPYVPEEAEAEVRAVFDQVTDARVLGGQAQAVADRHFFETVVRLHRAGEGAPYTGLKPAGLSHGPVIPLAERAVQSGDAGEVAGFLAAELTEEVEHRLAEVHSLAAARDRSLSDARRHVEAMLGFEVYCHSIHRALHAQVHSESGQAAHHHA
jgi:hypothetical protein